MEKVACKNMTSRPIAKVSGELAWYKLERVEAHKPCRWHSSGVATDIAEGAVRHLGEIRLCVRFAPKGQEDYLLKVLWCNLQCRCLRRAENIYLSVACDPHTDNLYTP